MKLDFFNDTKRALRLHTGTEQNNPRYVPPRRMVTFNLPDGCRPFVKLWEDGTLLVRGDEPMTLDDFKQDLENLRRGRA